MSEKITVKTEKPELRQMNLRVRDDVRESFKRFCTEHGATQSDALRLLLAQSDGNSSNEMLCSIEMDLKTEKVKSKELQEIIDNLRHNRESASHRCAEYASVVRGILQYILNKTPEKELKHLPVERNNIKYTPARREFRLHQYPRKTGVCSFTLESLIYGKGINAPLFVLGTASGGIPVKFRLYSKKEYIGIDPRNKDFGYEGSEWLMGYIIAKDGAADLYVSIPLDALWKDAAQKSLAYGPKTPLDMVIAATKNKK